MPYEMYKEGKTYCVRNSDTGESKGCSTSQRKAVDHMRALYAAEPPKKSTHSVEDTFDMPEMMPGMAPAPEAEVQTEADDMLSDGDISFLKELQSINDSLFLKAGETLRTSGNDEVVGLAQLYAAKIAHCAPTIAKWLKDGNTSYGDDDNQEAEAPSASQYARPTMSAFQDGTESDLPEESVEPDDMLSPSDISFLEALQSAQTALFPKLGAILSSSTNDDVVELAQHYVKKIAFCAPMISQWLKDGNTSSTDGEDSMVCPTCNGVGMVDFKEYQQDVCPTCNGSGMMQRPSMGMKKRMPMMSDLDIIEAGGNLKEYAWEGPIVFEGVATGDNRYFKPGSIQWDSNSLPWSFRWQKASTKGHQGAVPVGRLDSIERRDGGVIYGHGVIIPELNDEAAEYLRMIESGVASGVSVDGDSAEFDVVEGEGGQPRIEFSSMRLRSLTAVDIPAFDNARVSLMSTELACKETKAWRTPTTTSDPGGKVEAALIAAGIPVKPKTEWFTEPEFSGPTAITVTEDGAVYGHLALFNTCHIGFPGTCVTPPRGSKYRFFHTGEVETQEGDLVEVGHLTFKTGHAAMAASPNEAAAHYDHTGAVAADVRAGEDKYGIWVAGALRSTLSETDIREFRAAPLSGDWRRISGRLELVGALAVNVPGFPVPRVRAMVASGSTETLFTFTENEGDVEEDYYELQLRLQKKEQLNASVHEFFNSKHDKDGRFAPAIGGGKVKVREGINKIGALGPASRLRKVHLQKLSDAQLRKFHAHLETNSKKWGAALTAFGIAASVVGVGLGVPLLGPTVSNLATAYLTRVRERFAVGNEAQRRGIHLNLDPDGLTEFQEKISEEELGKLLPDVAKMSPAEKTQALNDGLQAIQDLLKDPEAELTDAERKTLEDGQKQIEQSLEKGFSSDDLILDDFNLTELVSEAVYEFYNPNHAPNSGRFTGPGGRGGGGGGGNRQQGGGGGGFNPGGGGEGPHGTRITKRIKLGGETVRYDFKKFGDLDLKVFRKKAKRSVRRLRRTVLGIAKAHLKDSGSIDFNAPSMAYAMSLHRLRRNQYLGADRELKLR